MAEFRKALEVLPRWLKIILALPGIDGIVWGIYRICRGDTPNLILGIVWIFIGAAIGWIVDIICLLTKGAVFELQE